MPGAGSDADNLIEGLLSLRGTSKQKPYSSWLQNKKFLGAVRSLLLDGVTMQGIADYLCASHSEIFTLQAKSLAILLSKTLKEVENVVENVAIESGGNDKVTVHDKLRLKLERAR